MQKQQRQYIACITYVSYCAILCHMTILEPSGEHKGENRRNPFVWLAPLISQKPAMQKNEEALLCLLFASIRLLAFGRPLSAPGRLPLSSVRLSPPEGGRPGRIQGQVPHVSRVSPLAGPLGQLYLFLSQAYSPVCPHLSSAGSLIKINRSTPDQRAQTSV